MPGFARSCKVWMLAGLPPETFVPVEAEPTIKMALCEQDVVVLRAGVRYLFGVAEGCAKCAELDKAYANERIPAGGVRAAQLRTGNFGVDPPGRAGEPPGRPVAGPGDPRRHGRARLGEPPVVQQLGAADGQQLHLDIYPVEQRAGQAPKVAALGRRAA